MVDRPDPAAAPETAAPLLLGVAPPDEEEDGMGEEAELMAAGLESVSSSGKKEEWLIFW